MVILLTFIAFSFLSSLCISLIEHRDKSLFRCHTSRDVKSLMRIRKYAYVIEFNLGNISVCFCCQFCKDFFKGFKLIFR